MNLPLRFVDLILVALCTEKWQCFVYIVTYPVGVCIIKGLDNQGLDK